MRRSGIYSIIDAVLISRVCRKVGSRNIMPRRSGLRKQVSTMADGRVAKINPGEPPSGSENTTATASWAAVPKTFRDPNGSLPPPWDGIFGPLRQGTIDDLMIVGQCGQSIDARIATPSGHSHYINSEDGLAHLHRLRALVDAVMIGVGTAVADDPQLTVRRVAGPNPARVIIDPNSRLPPTARALAADGARRLVITRAGARTTLPTEIEVLPIAADNGRLPPAAIVAALAAHGLRRILVEGGADTVSRFLAAGCLDRLHILVAPIILGAGRSSLALPPIERVDQAVRAPMRVHVLGRDVLLDCDLSAQRMAIGRAKISR
jgi:diaminohydroxyphosphoribosylaminopyrimidine deaminase / 5-amino-6-(5-phosphoribosylamino)uracil reductase